jgi:hypothetical protein
VHELEGMLEPKAYLDVHDRAITIDKNHIGWCMRVVHLQVDFCEIIRFKRVCMTQRGIGALMAMMRRRGDRAKVIWELCCWVHSGLVDICSRPHPVCQWVTRTATNSKSILPHIPNLPIDCIITL